LANGAESVTRVKGKSVKGRPVKDKPVFPGPVLSRTEYLVVAAALVSLAAVAGCSSSASTPAATVTTTVTASPSAPPASGSVSTAAPSQSAAVAGAPACPTSSLQAKLGLGQGYAGGVYQVIDFTNTSSATCSLYGYPGVSLVSGPPYRQIGLSAKRSPTVPVKLITLAPGATANAVVQIVEAQNFPASSCDPTTATNLQIYPPNQRTAIYLPSTAQGCAKSSQVLFISPVQSGSGGTS
jgi:hypothetical protein